jgi:hypothetical protein
MKTFAKIVASVLLFVTAASAVDYTNATVKGNYSLRIDGEGGALVGLLNFDGVSKTTLTYTQIGPVTATLSGTYTVESNGTGTITYSSSDPGRYSQFCALLGHEQQRKDSQCG